MTTRPFPSNNNASFASKTRAVFLALTISASLVILASLLYFLYHLWLSLLHRARTIPFDSTPPLKLQRFSYKELKLATADFDASNVIGKGGSGTVFRGILKSGKLIAIKRLDTLSLQTEREFQNELHILGGLRSPHLVALLGYCVEKNNRVLVYEYMPNKSLQESLFAEGFSSLSWERRFEIVSDVARALEFLHLGCDPPVIHGDIKPSNVLLDSDHRAKVSDFGLSRVKVEGEFGADMFSQDLGKSQELSGNLTAGTTTPAASTPNEVDFALALQASSSSKNGKACGNSNVKAKTGSEKGKELVSSNGTTLDCDWNHNKFVPYDDHYDEPCSFEHSKELMMMSSSNPCFSVDEGLEDSSKQWGKDWWWRQDGSGELCSKDYVTEWIGSQICAEKSQVEDHDHRSSSPLERLEFENRERKNNKPKKMQEWWREEHLAEMTKKKGKNHSKLIRGLEIRFKNGFKIPHFERFRFRRRRNSADKAPNERNGNDNDNGGEFSFRRGWRRKNRNNNNNNSIGSEFWSGDLFSRELSSTTSMRGTLCYVAPEYGGFGYLMEKADIYSFGVLILVIVSGRRPLHVLASPMKLEKANLISWCRQLAQAGNVLELVDEKLKDEYNKDQANLCINLALTCLQKTPELRPDIGDVVRILRGEMDLPPVPFEFSPSPSSKLYSRSRRKHKFTAE